MINFDSSIVNALMDSLASVISQLWELFAPLFGIILAFYFARKIIYLFPRK